LDGNANPEVDGTQHSACPAAQGKPHHTSEKSKQKVLDKDLSDQAALGSPQSGPYSYFVFAGGGPNQENIRHVKTGEQEHKPGERQE
jgi:hypothetical protein